MVWFGSESVRGKFAAGIVCPDCNEPVHGYSFFGVRTDRYGRTTRKYMAWCCRCKSCSEVEQFLMHNKWYIHHYRQWVDEGDKIVRKEGWTILNDLPDPAPIIIGPGGDYDRAIEL